jgi:hypothetical protein
MNTTETPGNVCLKCGYKFEAASGAYDNAITPEEGDISVCLNCGAALVFNKDLSLRYPTPEEKAEITMNKEVLQAQIVRAHVVTKDLRPAQHCDAGEPSPTAKKLAETLKPKHSAKLIKPDGSVIPIEPENGTDFSLEELNRMVGGYIEVVVHSTCPG